VVGDCGQNSAALLECNETIMKKLLCSGLYVDSVLLIA
jgi:hypothetical protein